MNPYSFCEMPAPLKSAVKLQLSSLHSIARFKFHCCPLEWEPQSPFLLFLHQRGWWWTRFSAIVYVCPLSYSHSGVFSWGVWVPQIHALCFYSIPLSYSKGRWAHVWIRANLRSWWEASLLWLSSVWMHWESRSQCLLTGIIFMGIFSYQEYWITCYTLRIRQCCGSNSYFMSIGWSIVFDFLESSTGYWHTYRI